MTETDYAADDLAITPDRALDLELYKLESHAALPVAQFARAPDDERRAAVLLQMSDHMMLAYGQKLGDLCQQMDFPAGADYCAVRLACLFAVRNWHGGQGMDQTNMAENARLALVRMVRG